MWRLVPAVLSCLLLAAHFLRWGNPAALALCLVVPGLACALRRRWTLRLLQGLLALGCLAWMQTGVSAGAERIAHGLPWIRLAVILGSVSGFTAVSAWLLQSPDVLEKYR